MQANYRNDGTVALMTRTGVGLLDVKPATFDFEPAGTLTAEKLVNIDPSKSAVGSLKLISSSGLTIDLVQQNVLQSGNLKALVDLRDKSLVAAQSQLDQVAAGLAQSLNTVTTQGTAASSGSQNGYSLDLSVKLDNVFVCPDTYPTFDAVIAWQTEVAKANGHPEWKADIQNTFAKRWIAKADGGTWYQDGGAWKQK